MRLFVALDLPPAVRAALGRIELGSQQDMRRARPAQMHLTLHFIGDADHAEIRAALETVRAGECAVEVCGLGRFAIAADRTILWAGVTRSDSLLELHAACAGVLQAVGVRIERRRYVPHVTIARFRAPAARAAIDELVKAGRSRAFGRFVAREFVLYDSVTQPGGAHYRRLARFALH